MSEVRIDPPRLLGDFSQSLVEIDRLAMASDEHYIDVDRNRPLDFMLFVPHKVASVRMQLEAAPMQAQAVLKVGTAALGLHIFKYGRDAVDIDSDSKYIDPWRLNHRRKVFEPLQPLRGIFMSSPCPVEFVHGTLDGYNAERLFRSGAASESFPNATPPDPIPFDQPLPEQKPQVSLRGDIDEQVESGNLEIMTVPAGQAVYVNGNNLYRRVFDGMSVLLLNSTVSLSSIDPLPMS